MKKLMRGDGTRHAGRRLGEVVAVVVFGSGGRVEMAGRRQREVAGSGGGREEEERKKLGSKGGWRGGGLCGEEQVVRPGIQEGAGMLGAIERRCRHVGWA